MRGTWIPALSGGLPELHLISPGAPLAAHVFCVDSREKQVSLGYRALRWSRTPQGLHMAGIGIPVLLPLVLPACDAAERVWDPLAGIPPSISLDEVAVSATVLVLGRPILGLLEPRRFLCKRIPFHRHAARLFSGASRELCCSPGTAGTEVPSLSPVGRLPHALSILHRSPRNHTLALATC